nr:UPF0193 protein EVG1 isoform X1 [Paramormyrops kingsleyae]
MYYIDRHPRKQVSCYFFSCSDDMSHNGDVARSSEAGAGLGHVLQYSKETQEMLKLMMKESKLTNFQQRQITSQLKKGGALPLTCTLTSLAPAAHPKPMVNEPSSLPVKPQKRSATICRSGDNYVREKFRPSAIRDLEMEKRRLQGIFAMGKEEEPKTIHFQDFPVDRGAEKEVDRFQDVLDEIEDRRQFLEEMAALGRGKCFQNIINTEISQRIRELEVIDRARSMEWKSSREEQRRAECPATAAD